MLPYFSGSVAKSGISVDAYKHSKFKNRDVKHF